MKVLRLYTTIGTFYSDGAHPDKIAYMLKRVKAMGGDWTSMDKVEMEPEMYQSIPATQSAVELFRGEEE